MQSISRRAVLILTIFAFSGAVVAQQGWQSRVSGTTEDLVSVYFAENDKGWIAGDNGFLAHTTNRGATWTKVELGTSENINEIYFRNEKNGYLVAGREMFQTDDAGNSWRKVSLYREVEARGTPEFLSIKFADRRRGIAVGSILNSRGAVIDSLVLRTEDGGETWQRVPVPPKTELFHLDFVGSSRVWIVGDRGVVLFSDNGGESFRQQQTGVERALYNVDFRDSKEGYAVGGRGTILRTEDGGVTWEKVTTSFPGTFMRVDFADDKNGWIVGHGGLILRSNDRGKTWIKQDSGTEQRIFGLFINKRVGWAVGASGTLLEYLR